MERLVYGSRSMAVPMVNKATYLNKMAFGDSNVDSDAFDFNSMAVSIVKA